MEEKILSGFRGFALKLLFTPPKKGSDDIE
jgi:hypothetical protein